MHVTKVLMDKNTVIFLYLHRIQIVKRFKTLKKQVREETGTLRENPELSVHWFSLLRTKSFGSALLLTMIIHTPSMLL